MYDCAQRPTILTIDRRSLIDGRQTMIPTMIVPNSKKIEDGRRRQRSADNKRKVQRRLRQQRRRRRRRDDDGRRQRMKDERS